MSDATIIRITARTIRAPCSLSPWRTGNISFLSCFLGIQWLKTVLEEAISSTSTRVRLCEGSMYEASLMLLLCISHFSALFSVHGLFCLIRSFHQWITVGFALVRFCPEWSCSTRLRTASLSRPNLNSQTLETNSSRISRNQNDNDICTMVC